MAELEAQVTELRDREAIRECLTRYSRGIDRFDRELLLSAYHPNAIDDHGKFIGTPAEFADWAFKQHTEAHLSHQHCLFQHRCELDGAVAHTETYFMFAGMNRQGPPLVLNGGRYLDRFEKRDGVWAIAYRTCVRDWGLMDERPDMAQQASFTSTRALLPEHIRDFMNTAPGPRRDAGDLSYQRPLRADQDRLTAWNAL
ncbi:nuclear transport factor 2 family protein [Amycolatopsis sp. K13G38]|uniref:Nuclear transport factor 2 family protein n=1 Tax=Amycolatopsis acididurans TaxID=2724524 RepID=A0ABX1J6V4_9PSEU|nr:nuclear transport factor 2 family protein [Amycolatopsis acididurans]